MLNIIISYLSNRTFRIAANGRTSSIRVAENGVPQGSILSVTLFLVAMQPIFANIPQGVQILVYADDVILIAKGQNFGILRRMIRSAVTALTSWTASVGFSIEPSKSKLLHICKSSHRKRGRAVNVNGIPIPRVRKMKILGILIDSKLNFLQHFAETKRSCTHRINILRILGCRLARSSRVKLLKVGEALIFSKMVYGIGLTSRNIEALERILSPTYNEIIRQASGAFRTSPVVSVVAEASCLPFRLKIIQRLTTLAIRLMEKNDLAERLPVVKRASELFLEATGLIVPKIKSVIRLTNRKWYTKPPKIDDTLKNSIKAGTSSQRVLPMFAELMNTMYISFRKLYTDGSKVLDKTGIGITTETYKSSSGLPGICSIFSAEAYALKEAVAVIRSDEPTIILTDSASCLDAIRGGKSTHPWIQAVEHNAHNKRITFSWIPGHAGIPGNVEADKLANEGRSKIPIETAIPAQDVIRYTKNLIWCAWENDWRRSAAHLRQIKPSVAEFFDRNNASEQRILTRLRIGHTRLTHSYLLEKTCQPVCRFCGTHLTVHHILVDCIGFITARRNCGIVGTFPEILANNDKKERAVIKFIKEIDLYKSI